jgi:hypothetical protein
MWLALQISSERREFDSRSLSVWVGPRQSVHTHLVFKPRNSGNLRRSCSSGYDKWNADVSPCRYLASFCMETARIIYQWIRFEV